MFSINQFEIYFYISTFYFILFPPWMGNFIFIGNSIIYFCIPPIMFGNKFSFTILFNFRSFKCCCNFKRLPYLILSPMICYTSIFTIFFPFIFHGHGFIVFFVNCVCNKRKHGFGYNFFDKNGTTFPCIIFKTLYIKTQIYFFYSFMKGNFNAEYFSI